MEANELRIGNIFEGLIIESITKTGVNFYAGYEGYIETEFEDLKPIPLTEGWLLDLGLRGRRLWVFEIFGDNERGFHISSEGGEWIFIKYVHQLQNLYFALTGEELEVK